VGTNHSRIRRILGGDGLWATGNHSVQASIWEEKKVGGVVGIKQHVSTAATA